MADDSMKKHADLNIEVRNTILDSIRSTIEREKSVNLSNVGSISGVLDQLAARNLYSKGPPDDNYSKNTQRHAFDERILPTDFIKGLLP